MSTSDIIAYIGAAAWLPQIGQWLYSWAKRPKLRVVPGGEATIGYTNFGPVVVVPLAIACERRSAVITSARLRTVHAEGQTMRMAWTILREPQTQLQLTLPGAPQQMEFAKTQPALALKVTTESLVERQVTFTDPDFRRQLDPLIENVVRRRERLTGLGGAADENLERMDEFVQARDNFAAHFSWREGRYNIDLELSGSDFAPHGERFSFELTRAQIDVLARNRDEQALLTRHVEALLEQRRGGQPQWAQWAWANAPITRSS